MMEPDRTNAEPKTISIHERKTMVSSSEASLHLLLNHLLLYHHF